MPINKRHLSGSTNGRPIPVAATATPGTLIHTAVAGGAQFDEVFLFANNATDNSVPLTVQLGGVSDPGDHAPDEFMVPPHSALWPILPGLILNGGLELRAFGGTASALNVTGYVNRIS